MKVENNFLTVESTKINKRLYLQSNLFINKNNYLYFKWVSGICWSKSKKYDRQCTDV